MSALSIAPASTPVLQNGTVGFSASGGTAPYSYAVIDGEGSIDSDGLFTAPPQSGVTIVQATDSAGATAKAQVTVHTALTLFCDIIAQELALAGDQVYLWDQKINIPADHRMYVAVGVLSCKPFSNANLSVGSDDDMVELQSTNFQATLSVDIISRGKDARDRKEEVILALNSTYSRSQQERYGFYIAPLSSGFVNLSNIEGAAIPYRFNISVGIHYSVTKQKSVDYFDTFQDATVSVEP